MRKAYLYCAFAFLLFYSFFAIVFAVKKLSEVDPIFDKSPPRDRSSLQAPADYMNAPRYDQEELDEQEDSYPLDLAYDPSHRRALSSTSPSWELGESPHLSARMDNTFSSGQPSSALFQSDKSTFGRKKLSSSAAGLSSFSTANEDNNLNSSRKWRGYVDNLNDDRMNQKDKAASSHLPQKAVAEKVPAERANAATPSSSNNVTNVQRAPPNLTMDIKTMSRRTHRPTKTVPQQSAAFSNSDQQKAVDPNMSLISSETHLSAPKEKEQQNNNEMPMVEQTNSMIGQGQQNRNKQSQNNNSASKVLSPNLHLTVSKSILQNVRTQRPPNPPSLSQQSFPRRWEVQIEASQRIANRSLSSNPSSSYGTAQTYSLNELDIEENSKGTKEVFYTELDEKWEVYRQRDNGGNYIKFRYVAVKDWLTEYQCIAPLPHPRKLFFNNNPDRPFHFDETGYLMEKGALPRSPNYNSAKFGPWIMKVLPSMLNERKKLPPVASSTLEIPKQYPTEVSIYEWTKHRLPVHPAHLVPGGQVDVITIDPVATVEFSKVFELMDDGGNWIKIEMTLKESGGAKYVRDLFGNPPKIDEQMVLFFGGKRQYFDANGLELSNKTIEFKKQREKEQLAIQKVNQEEEELVEAQLEKDKARLEQSPNLSNSPAPQITPYQSPYGSPVNPLVHKRRPPPPAVTNSRQLIHQQQSYPPHLPAIQNATQQRVVINAGRMPLVIPKNTPGNNRLIQKP